MEMTAIIKWNNEKVFIKPILFAWHVGINFKTLTGYHSASIFCDRRDYFYFPISTKIKMIPIYVWYWLRFWLYMELRYWIPNRLKKFYNKQKYNINF